MSTTLYLKTITDKGKVRYVPYGEQFDRRTLQFGHWHVHTAPGITTLTPIKPDNLAWLAAASDARDAMVSAMTHLRPFRSEDSDPVVNEALRAAHDAYLRVMASHKRKVETYTFPGISMVDVVNAGIAAITPPLGLAEVLRNGKKVWKVVTGGEGLAHGEEIHQLVLFSVPTKEDWERLWPCLRCEPKILETVNPPTS